MPDGKSIPGFAKFLLLVQTLIILFMSFWIYQEYQNNTYLQSYVNGNFQAGSFTTLMFISIGLFTIIAIGLYLKLRSIRRELEGVLSTGTIGSGGTRRGQADTRAEEHLIEMIRKTTPVMNSGTGGPMPMLRRRDSQYSGEEQGSSQ